jgi:hypothetical protein
MKLGKAIFKTTLSIAVFSLMLIACKKSSTNENDSDVRPAEDQSTAEITFNDAQQIADEAATTGSLSNFRNTNNTVVMSGCATVTRDLVSNPRRVTVDFGTANCMCADGKNRRGKVIITFTGAYKDPGTVINISFDNYFVNDNQVLGTKTVTNNGRNNNGNLSWTVSVNGSVVLASNGGTINWVSTRTREMIAGEATPLWTDDIYLITGSGTLTSSNGRNCSFNIINALRREIGCRWITSGKVEITPQNRPARTLDFGSGACDNQATVTILGQTFPITLR